MAAPIMFRCHRRISLWWWFWGILTTGATGHYAVEFTTHLQPWDLIMTLMFATQGIFNTVRLRNASGAPFIILTSTAGYDQADGIHGLITFRDVMQATETASSLEIRLHRHGNLFSDKRKVVIPRHRFAAEDWDQLIAILLERIRAQSPDAIIRTALHPEG